jgi:hypothetical protein
MAFSSSTVDLLDGSSESGNTGKGGAGGLWVQQSTLVVSNSKINNNFAATGNAGGVYEPEAFQWQHVSGPARLLLWAGITDADQSPTLPTHMPPQEEKLKPRLKSMDTGLTSISAKEDAIHFAENKFQVYITDQLETLSQDVHKVNIQETHSIDNVEPTVGAPGPPGYHGSNGHCREGLTGLTGTTRRKGGPGPQGVAGKMGKPGVKGDQGPIGPEGQAGFAGPFPQRCHL